MGIKFDLMAERMSQGERSNYSKDLRQLSDNFSDVLNNLKDKIISGDYTADDDYNEKTGNRVLQYIDKFYEGIFLYGLIYNSLVDFETDKDRYILQKNMHHIIEIQEKYASHLLYMLRSWESSDPRLIRLAVQMENLLLKLDDGEE